MTEVQLDIVDIGRRGEGIARHDDRAVFAPGTLPGETIRADIQEGRTAGMRIVTPSPDRCAPFCAYYGTCGGCQLQHWREDPYRTWKKQLVQQSFAARGIETSVDGLIDAHGTGRRRVSIHVRRMDGSVSAGYMAARSHHLLDIERCPILVPQLDRAFDIARTIGRKLGDCDVALTATASGIDASIKAERKIVERELPGLAGLAVDLKLARLSVNTQIVATTIVPRVTMGKAEVIVPPLSFLQATEQGEATLAKLVLDGIGKAGKVADLFCGCGPFALRLAERYKVEAYDNDRPAIAALVAATKAAPGLKPITALARDLLREPLVANELRGIDAVVFDPPRAGAEAQSRQLAKSKVKTVVAVSCDPASLARDAAILVEGGYRLIALTAVDQFKWTSHVEAVAVFRRS